MIDENSRKLLKAVYRVFEAAGVQCFADSGTLLGIVRNGDLLSYDNDVDLGMVDFDENSLGCLREECLVRGIELSEKRYLGKVSGINFKWIQPGKSAAVHAHIYFEHGDYYCSPQIVKYRKPSSWPRGRRQVIAARKQVAKYLGRAEFQLQDFAVTKLMDSSQPGSIRSLANAVGRIAYWVLYQAYYKPRHRRLPEFGQTDRYKILRRKKSRRLLAAYTWVVPKHLFQSTTEVDFEGTSIRIPKQCKDYLSLRYGESWETPNRNWIFFLEDGLLYAAPYEYIVPRLLGDASELSHPHTAR